MSKPDLAHRLTDQELDALEKRIAAEYQKAADELQGKIDAYFESLKKRDEETKALIGTIVNGREYTRQDYEQWRLAQIGRGERFEALRDRLAERMTRANEVAAAYINDSTPGVYSLNRNYAAYTIERQAGADMGFDLWDEQTVKRLIVERPDLMPYYPPKRAIKRGIDLAYGKQQITKHVTSSILQGEGIKQIADRLQKDIPAMNRTSAIRAARTAVTGAQNGGRMDSYRAAEEMGIDLEREWIATLDNRTRHAHRALDRQRAAMDKPFEVDGHEIWYPGDSSAPGYLVYNCRCTMISDVKGVPKSSNPLRRARDPETGKSILISDMSYAQWETWKSSENRYVWETYQKQGKNYSADQKQYAKYKSVIGGSMPKSFADFQDLKYNSPKENEAIKGLYRYKGRVPEATERDYEAYLKIKETGVAGSVRVPPEKTDAAKLAFRDGHAARHGCSLEDARSYVEGAYCSITRKRWDGVSVNYYSKDGAAYIDKDSMEVKTAFKRSDYDALTKSIVEVFE